MSKPSILIVEDENLMRISLCNFCKKMNFLVFSASTGKEAIELFKNNNIDIVLLDMRLPDADGKELFAIFKKLDDQINIIMITAFPDFKTVVSVIKNGAFDYLVKPFELEELKQTILKALEIKSLKNEVLRLKQQNKQYEKDEIISYSNEMKSVLDIISKVANAPKTPVLFTGESGTGKELVTNLLHKLSQRNRYPLVKVNCSALPEHLLESELFGYEKGAFTGANKRKPGLFELADGGSIFLDEISEMHITVQPKLLRILDGHPFKRLGGTKDIYVDVRIITAFNKDPKKLIEDGLFREDLFYRLSTFVINIPPLRKRKEDILPLAKYFLKKNSQEIRKKIETISNSTQLILKNYQWPGNIRELKNIIERAVILCDTDSILPEHLPNELQFADSKYFENSNDLTIESMEKLHIKRVMKEINGNKSEVARQLGIARSTLEEKLKKYS